MCPARGGPPHFHHISLSPRRKSGVSCKDVHEQSQGVRVTSSPHTPVSELEFQPWVCSARALSWHLAEFANADREIHGGSAGSHQGTESGRFVRKANWRSMHGPGERQKGGCSRLRAGWVNSFVWQEVELRGIKPRLCVRG